MIKIKTNGDKDSIKILSWSLIKNNLDNLKNIEVYVKDTEDAKEYVSMIKFKNISELMEEDEDKIIYLPNNVYFQQSVFDIQPGLYRVHRIHAFDYYLNDDLFSNKIEYNKLVFL